MFEVKYPKADGYDGKVHQIQILEAYEVEHGKNKEVIIYGLDNGKNVTLFLRYDQTKKSFVMVVHSKMEMINITSPFLERKDITDILIKQLQDTRISNALEKEERKQDEETLNVQKIKEINHQEYIEELVEKVDEYIKKNYDPKDDERKNKKEIKKELVSNTEYTADDILRINYKKAIKLLKEFLATFNATRENYKREYFYSIKDIFCEISRNILQIPSVLFTEDDLIDLGSFIAKLHVERVNKLSQEEFDRLMKIGYDINEKICQIPKKK